MFYFSQKNVKMRLSAKYEQLQRPDDTRTQPPSPMSPTQKSLTQQRKQPGRLSKSMGARGMKRFAEQAIEVAPVRRRTASESPSLRPVEAFSETGTMPSSSISRQERQVVSSAPSAPPSRRVRYSADLDSSSSSGTFIFVRRLRRESDSCESESPSRQAVLLSTAQTPLP